MKCKQVQLIKTEEEQKELECEDIFDFDEYLCEESDMFHGISKSSFEYIIFGAQFALWTTRVLVHQSNL